MSNNTVLPKMIEKIVERLEGLSDNNMSTDDIVRAYEALNQMDSIIDTITMSKHRRYKPMKEELPTTVAYGIVTKPIKRFTWT